MEASQLLLLLLSLIPVVYLFFHKIITNNADVEKRRLPPGSTGWPLLGETLDYFLKVQQGVPYEFVTERMKKYSSKIFRTSLIGEPVVIIGSAEGNKFLLSNEDKLVQVWWPSSMEKLFPKTDNKPNYEHSKSKRKLLPVVLKVDALREYVGLMDEIMKKHLQTDWTGQQARVAEMAKKYTLTLAINIFLGIYDPPKIAELAEGMEAVSTAFQSIPYNLPGSALNRGIKASKIIRKEIEGMVRQRKFDLSKNCASSAKDFVLHMLMARDDNGEFFNEKDIASHLLGLVIGGYTTMHGTITIIMKYLAELPDLYNYVLREQLEIARLKNPKDRITWEDVLKMKYSWSVACEVLRLWPPAPGSFREAVTDFTYEGYTIPKGWKIHMVFHATQKNPEYFPNPEKFDPSRFQKDGLIPYTFVPFGGGMRMCPGNEYARLAILIFVHNVVTKFRLETAIPEEKFVYYPYPSPAEGLLVRLHPHKA